MSAILDLACQLIEQPSITPDDKNCQEILIRRLQKLGFAIEKLPFGQVKNFWARHGTNGPLFVFVGHTDVVPPGPLEAWTSPPFKPEVRSGFLYGRGAADMKGSVAAMMVACENFIAAHPQHKGSIAWLITSDEEGASIDGTGKVVDVLIDRKQKVDWCLVGEASSDKILGDIIKIGRRGTLSGHLTIHGRQGHVAYPQLADNPIHKALPALAELVTTVWDEGNTYFQPTSLQISNIKAGTGAGNVIPGTMDLQFNLRYSPLVTAEDLQKRIEGIFNKHHLAHTLVWHHSGKPFLTTQGELVDACSKAIKAISNVEPQLSTIGGTSDGRFMAATGCQIVEVGPCNHTIHQINECVSVAELENLEKIYRQILENLLL